MITISTIRRATEQDRRGINRVTPQVSSNGGSMSMKEFRDIVRDRNTTIVVARDKERIVGMGILAILRTPLKLRAEVECVVVDEAYRGQGIGRHLMEKIITTARKLKLYSIQLTSRPSRKAAQKLYQGVGFEKAKTNVYRMKLRAN